MTDDDLFEDDLFEDDLFEDDEPGSGNPAAREAAEREAATKALFARLDDTDVQVIRPWSWTELPAEEAAALMRLLAGFVEDFNRRYAWTPDQLVPPCWPAHGGLLEELTTLWWSRYAAFDAPGAKAADAQAWHEKSLPGFLKRMPTWLSPSVCVNGKHTDPDIWPARSQAADGLSPQARDLTRRWIEAELGSYEQRTMPRRPHAEPDDQEQQG